MNSGDLVGREVKLVPDEINSDSLNTAQTDKEFFIRKSFEQDSVKGYELLFRQYYSPLCGHAVTFVYNREVAEDLVAEVFYTFWKKKLHEQITTSFRACLFTSGANRERAIRYLYPVRIKVQQPEPFPAGRYIPPAKHY